jgi:hypothetical protein
MNNAFVAIILTATGFAAQARSCTDILFDLKMRADPAVTVPEYIAELDARLRADDAATKARCVFKRDFPDEAEAQEQAEAAAKKAEAARLTAARDAELARVMALPGARIGMTAKQVVERTNWGRPSEVNRTTTRNVVREQWVYSSRRLLYFDNGILTAIQD